jgi:hypothetical protein
MGSGTHRLAKPIGGMNLTKSSAQPSFSWVPIRHVARAQIRTLIELFALANHRGDQVNSSKTGSSQAAQHGETGAS